MTTTKTRTRKTGFHSNVFGKIKIKSIRKYFSKIKFDSFWVESGHLEDILDISWSTDGNTLISGSVDNSVIVWNVLTDSF